MIRKRTSSLAKVPIRFSPLQTGEKRIGTLASEDGKRIALVVPVYHLIWECNSDFD